MQRKTNNKKIIMTCLLGAPQVGKTSLLVAYINRKFSERYRNTYAPDFLTKDVAVDGENYCFQMWDTETGYIPSNPSSNTCNIPSYVDRQMANMEIIFVCFEKGNRKTLEHAEKILSSLFKMSPGRHEIVLVGTKSDYSLSSDHKRISDLMEKYGIKKYVETSARDFHNLKEAFDDTFTQYIATLQKTVSGKSAPVEAKTQVAVLEGGKTPQPESQIAVPEASAAPNAESQTTTPDERLKQAAHLVAFNLFNQAKQAWLTEHPEAKDAHLRIKL